MTNQGLNELDEITAALEARLDAKALDDLVFQALGEDLPLVNSVAGGRRLSLAQAARCLAALHGRNILSARAVRSAVAGAAHPDDLELAFRDCYRASSSLRSSASFSRQERIEVVASRPWHQGSRWARDFCEIFRLPPSLAGHAANRIAARTERVEPFVPLSPLHDFQLNMGYKLDKLLDLESAGRALLALPTGAGKTRLVVDTLLRRPDFERGLKKIVWVAQHNELCEQAVQCFAQVWRSQARPGHRALGIQRVWKGLADELDWDCDVFVGTAESLTPRLAASSKAERHLLGIAVIDEAHHAAGDSYAALFGLLSSGPIVGVTATPGTSAKALTRYLRMRFMDRVLLADELGQDPVSQLQEMGILARPIVETVHTKIRVDSGYFGDDARDTFGDLPASALQRLGSNVTRNRVILNRILMLDDDAHVLCFAPSVKSARAIAAALAFEGRDARSVDAESDINYRNESVALFNAGRIRYLINYGVLATGFDAPRVNWLVLARPTTSPVLYEQMLGRGLRGPLNGGTVYCTVIHFEDDFTAFGGVKPMSYARFLEWNS